MKVRTFLTVLGALALALVLVSRPALSQEKADGTVSVGLNSETDATQAENKDDKFKLEKPNHRFFNLRVGLGVAGGLGDDLDSGTAQGSLGSVGGQFTIGVDFEVFPPLSVAVLGGYTFFFNGDDSSLEEAFIAGGVMGRFLTDKSGSLKEGGSIRGSLWADAYFGYFNADVYSGSASRAGYILGVGYDFAIAKDINLGPYFRFQQTPIGEEFDYFLLAGGIQLSLGGQFKADDYDKDTVPDEEDECIDKPEDLDGFDDLDGCPDLDNDEDGINDEMDKCPEDPELENGIDDDDGCPEKDDDLDGVLDAVDRCPTEAEDRDGFEDEDGCADLDNDKDGVADAKDKCPDDAEDKDGFQDDDGCPDLDNDGDGLADSGDKCPNDAENVDGVEDEDGCPDGEAAKPAPEKTAPAKPAEPAAKQ